MQPCGSMLSERMIAARYTGERAGRKGSLRLAREGRAGLIGQRRRRCKRARGSVKRSIWEGGGRYRARTCDLLRVKQALVPTELTAPVNRAHYMTGPFPRQGELAFRVWDVGPRFVSGEPQPAALAHRFPPLAAKQQRGPLRLTAAGGGESNEEARPTPLGSGYTHDVSAEPAAASSARSSQEATRPGYWPRCAGPRAGR